MHPWLKDQYILKKVTRQAQISDPGLSHGHIRTHGLVIRSKGDSVSNNNELITINTPF